MPKADAEACAAREGGHTVDTEEQLPLPTAEGAALCATPGEVPNPGG
ncbi:hypothetical protein [Brenneria izbisi]|uniref:Uncharacterized protein n=1 Tax=Brenneria izbisi TaxID=2939450 RepID=A0AA41Y350_9GAMM|nr:hypothetical protein [Brenneria izbisi]MCV9879822.1 hypothetical protein [Brenneria izbisi]MCV9883211.1 hypothetical protein [Brenneria izbisi]